MFSHDKAMFCRGDVSTQLSNELYAKNAARTQEETRPPRSRPVLRKRSSITDPLGALKWRAKKKANQK
ncbi:hypothetical protein GCK32_008199 [Trichostrongylus colubriformis]|uniref:Uncharacterized protein n=1 Tax=Trichostrongylus colubriformis TaxID=6319 RepID=A0AAN8FJJ0_TRICO